MTEAQAQTGIRSTISHRVAPYVVVSNPGTVFARIEDHCITSKQAHEFAEDYEQPVDVMKVLPSGLLTTEL